MAVSLFTFRLRDDCLPQPDCYPRARGDLHVPTDFYSDRISDADSDYYAQPDRHSLSNPCSSESPDHLH